jgi:hypothetical protein
MKFCPECGASVEGKKFCSECGYKVQNESTAQPTNDSCALTTAEQSVIEKLSGQDLSVGKPITNWLGDTAIQGENREASGFLPIGKIHVVLHERGIGIFGAFFMPIRTIHSSQIVSMEELTTEQLKDKSVVGRAVIGTLVLGPLGGIVGGMSGIGQKSSHGYCFVLNYLDEETGQTNTLSILCASSSSRFIKRTYAMMER